MNVKIDLTLGEIMALHEILKDVFRKGEPVAGGGLQVGLLNVLQTDLKDLKTALAKLEAEIQE